MAKVQKDTEAKPVINDLIFKELIKRGYSLEGKTRVWNIADSKLWYLTPNQAQSFLNLEDEPSYKKDVTQKEMDLIEGNMSEIIAALGNSPVNIIDLGCGDGRKASLFIEKLKGKVKLRYCPIDISSYMVNKALERIKGLDAGEVVKFQWNISDFENVENVASLLRNGEYTKNLFLLMGNTLGNFEINEFLYEIRSGMKEGDVLVIGNGLDNRHPEVIMQSYNNDHFKDFSMEPLRQLGFTKDDLEFGVRYRNSRVESFFTIKKLKTIDFLNKTVHFFAGDQIVVVISYKYRQDDFIAFLKMYFDGVNTYVSKDKSYALAICKK